MSSEPMRDTPLPTAGELRDGAHFLPVRVYYEDTDFTGVVYHASYLRFLERGRTDFLRVLGVHHQALWAAEDAVAFAIRRLTVEYLKPARVDDALVVVTQGARATGVRLFLHQEIRRGDEILVTAEIEAVSIGRDGRAKRPSESLRESLKPFLDKA